MDMQPFMGSLGTGAGIGAGGGVAFFAFKWLVEWISGRMDKKQERLDRIQDDIITGLLKDVERLKAEGGEMRCEIKALREQLNECETRHVEAERKVARLEATIANRKGGA